MPTTKTTEEYRAQLAAGRQAELLARAADPATPPADLACLLDAARYQYPEVVRAIASNPSVDSAEAWGWLAMLAPREVVHNPSFLAAIKDDAEIIGSLWSENTDALLTPDTPPEVAAVLVAQAGAFSFLHLEETEFTREQFEAMLPAALPAWRGALDANPAAPRP